MKYLDALARSGAVRYPADGADHPPPTALVVSQQDESSQATNKAKAMNVLRSCFYERETRRRRDEIAGVRRSQVGADGRPEDPDLQLPAEPGAHHRAGFTAHRLTEMLNGDPEEISRSLAAHHRAGVVEERRRRSPHGLNRRAGRQPAGGRSEWNGAPSRPIIGKAEDDRSDALDGEDLDSGTYYLDKRAGHV